MPRRKIYNYIPIEEDEIDFEMEGLENIWKTFKIDIIKKLFKIRTFDYEICFHTMTKVVKRVDRTKEHFKRFHPRIQLYEPKKAAIYAYWINKLKPIYARNKEVSEKINVVFAIYLIVKTIFVTENVERAKGNKFNSQFDEEFVDSLLYSMQYHNLTEKNLILLIEAIIIYDNN